LSGYTANRPYARRGEAALGAPIAQDGRSIVFTDIRGKLFDENQREGNAALGYRHLGASGWNSGLWIGFDRRRTEYGTDFDQLSFGGELLSASWDLRVNGYLPLKDSELVSATATGSGTVEVVGSEIFLTPDGTSSLYELAFRGVDAEDGARAVVRGTLIIDTASHGIALGANEVELDIRDSIIQDTLGSGLFISGSDVAITVADTTFEGSFGEAAFRFNTGLATITSSTGNPDRMTSGIRCIVDSGTFTGFVQFEDETIIDDAYCVGP
jgi:hypothetical protein